MFKRGQVTIFAIISILIIAIIVLFIFLRGNIQKEEIYQPEVAPIANFVQECIEETVEEAVYYLALHGGYLDPMEISETGETYYYQNGTFWYLTKEEAEKEIQDYFKRNFFICSSHFLDFPDYIIEEGNFDIIAEIYQEKVLLKINYPITIKKEGKTLMVENFGTEINTRFGTIYQLIDEFLKTNPQESLCLSCFSEIFNKKGFRSEIILTDKNTITFKIIDSSQNLNERDLEWVFTIKY